MNSGTFHVSAQEWRYFSREKSIIHTLHLSQLPTGTTGETVLIDATSPANNNNGGFHVPPVEMPFGTGADGLSIQFSISLMVLSTCFGSVGMNKNILAQRNMDIAFDTWYNNKMSVTFVPKESGWFMIHGEVQSDQRNLTYRGPTSSDVVAVAAKRFITDIRSAADGFVQTGLVDATHWNGNIYTLRKNHASFTAIKDVGVGRPVYVFATDPGVYPDAYMSCYMWKFGEL